MNSWSSIVQKGVPIDYAEKMKVHVEYVSILRELYGLLHRNRKIVINARDASIGIQEREIGFQERNSEGKFYRERKVPKKKNKNHQTKPKHNDNINDITEKVRYIRSVVDGD